MQNTEENARWQVGASRGTSQFNHKVRMRLPPYSRQLRPSEICIWLFTGPTAWEWASNDTRNKLLLPPEHDPAAYRWPVSCKNVVILDTGSPDAYLRRLAWALLNTGALRVDCIPRDAVNYVIFSQKAVRHAE